MSLCITEPYSGKRGHNCTTQSRFLTTLVIKPFENIVGKGEDLSNRHFILFPQCFPPHLRQEASFSVSKCFEFSRFDKKLNFCHTISAFKPDGKIVDWYKLKKIADDILECI